jgi:hypothetical protein
MTTPIPLTIPTHLTDVQLVDSVKRCVRDERHATAALIAHLAEMDARLIHLREGYPSLFGYCCGVLRLSESATYKRIEVARAVRRFPAVLDLLSQGRLNLTTARLVAPHLTNENHAELLAATAGLGKRAVEALVAARFPRPDVPPLVRKLPTPRGPLPVTNPPGARGSASPAAPEASSAAPEASSAASVAPIRPAPSRVPPPLCVPLAADRYQIRFTASGSTWRKLCMARDLLRHAVPSGDPSEIFERALTALIADLARKKCALVKSPRRKSSPPAPGSRGVPADVRREVWIRDQGRCAYVSPGGRRCGDRAFLEFHHVKPYALDGPPTVANIELRCRAHNRYEAQVVFDRPTENDVSGPNRAMAGGSDVRSRASDPTGPGASQPPHDAVGPRPGGGAPLPARL